MASTATEVEDAAFFVFLQGKVLYQLFPFGALIVILNSVILSIRVSAKYYVTMGGVRPFRERARARTSCLYRRGTDSPGRGYVVRRQSEVTEIAPSYARILTLHGCFFLNVASAFVLCNIKVHVPKSVHCGFVCS